MMARCIHSGTLPMVVFGDVLTPRAADIAILTAGVVQVACGNFHSIVLSGRLQNSLVFLGVSAADGAVYLC